MNQFAFESTTLGEEEALEHRASLQQPPLGIFFAYRTIVIVALLEPEA